MVIDFLILHFLLPCTKFRRNTCHGICLTFIYKNIHIYCLWFKILKLILEKKQEQNLEIPFF